MSKNIIIQEGGVAKQLTADKLKTNLSGGGTCNWVPEDETQLQVKYIDANGEYDASADEVYGYSKVVVRVPGGAGGEGPGGSGDAVPGGPGSSVVGTDGDGDEAEVSVDEGGEIHTQKLPSSIKVLEPPTNPYGIYQDGQVISTDGMRVDAYLKSGDRWQTVPSNKITITPTVAVYDESKDPGGRRGTATLDGVSIDYGAGAISCDYPAVVSNFDYCVHRSRDVHTFVKRTNAPLNIFYSNTGTEQSYPVSAGGQTAGGTQFYLATINVGDSSLPIIPSLSNTDVATILYDGTREETPAGSTQTITASWPQPSTGKPLTDTFEILVAPGYTPNSGT